MFVCLCNFTVRVKIIIAFSVLTEWFCVLIEWMNVCQKKDEWCKNYQNWIVVDNTKWVGGYERLKCGYVPDMT